MYRQGDVLIIPVKAIPKAVEAVACLHLQVVVLGDQCITQPASAGFSAVACYLLQEMENFLSLLKY